MPADMPCQNQIDLLTGASFIQWVVLCTDPFNYLCLNKKKTGLKEKKPYDLCIHGTLDQGALLLKSNHLACFLRSHLSGCHATLPFLLGRRCVTS